MKKSPIALALAALFPLSAWSAEPVALDTVEVTTTRFDDQVLSRGEVDKATIESLRATVSDSASLLRDIPGVSLYGAGGVSSLPAIHGLADDRVRTQVDGMDLIAACPNHMNPALSYIDPSRVESVEVYAGVTPVSVGGDSLGGSIIVNSKAPKFAKAGEGMLAEGELGAFFRSNGDARGANIGVTLANDNLSIAYAGSTARSDNYIAGGDFKTTTATGRLGHTLPLDEVGSTAYKAHNHALDVAWRNGNHQFDLKLTRQDVPFENFPNQRMDMTANDSDRIKLGYTGQYAWGQLKAQVYREDTDHKMDFGADKRFWYGTASGGPGAANGTPCSPLGMTCAAGMPMDTEVDSRGLAVHAELSPSERDTVRVGGEYHAYRLDDWWPPSGAGMWPGTFWNVKNGERDRYALFGEWQAQLNPRWTRLLGVRYETVRMNADDVHGYSTAATAMGNQFADMNAFNALDHKVTDHNWDVTALARYTPSKTQTYEFGLARKTRSPSLYELYPWSTWTMAAVMNNFVGDGNGYVGNLDLNQEVAHTLSVAADWHAADGKAWGVRVAPYYTRVSDFIDARCRPGTTCAVDKFNVLQYVNQDARLYGFDLSGQAWLAGSPALGDLTLSGVLNYTRGENRDTGDNLYNIMPLNAKLALTQNLGRWSHTLEAQFVAAKDDVSAVRNEIATDGYSLVNLRGRYQWKQVRLDVGVENLFDTDYDLPLGGTYTGQGTTMSINGIPWGMAVPGPGRSIYAGVSMKF